MNRFRNKPYIWTRPLGRGAVAILLALSVSAMAESGAAAANNETQTADRKGIRSSGKASRLSAGKLT
ncbi:MAG: hypothetical protein ACKOL0_00820, partial [Solirubrobacterales bacterium]